MREYHKSILVSCQYCKKDFKALYFKLKKGEGKFCSNLCRYKGSIHKKPQYNECLVCKVQIPIWRKYCSVKCMSKNYSLIKAEKHPNWTSIEKNCLTCNRNFFKSPSQNKNGEGKYCSRKCVFEDKKLGEYKYCKTCKRVFYVPRNRLKIAQYCSAKCHALSDNPFLKLQRFIKLKTII